MSAPKRTVEGVQEPEGGRSGRVWLLCDGPDVVSVHSSENGAHAARLQRIGHQTVEVLSAPTRGTISTEKRISLIARSYSISWRLVEY